MPGVAARIQTIGETAHDRILDMMLSGAFRPGETLQERRLAEILDMSRTPVREALHRLEIEGLIERVAGRCTMLTEPSVRDIVEVFDVRRIVEVEAAGLAARRGLASDVFDALHEQLEHLRKANRPSFIDHWRADEAFHRSIADAAGNTTMCNLIIGLRRRSHIASWQRMPNDLREGAGEGLELLAAIRAGDEALSRALMKRHIDAAVEIVVRQLVSGYAFKVA